jgi:type II secretory pathway component PulJ
MSTCKKKSFTLIEIVIGLLLAAILVGGLFEIQRQFTLLQNKVEQAKQTVFERQRFYSRLAQIFKNLDSCRIDDNAAVSSEKVLVLEYVSDLDHDRNFRGKCTASLHKDGNNLILATQSKAERKEVLLKLEKGTTIQFSVFDMHPLKDSPIAKGWVQDWSADLVRDNLTAFGHCMLKITLSVPKKKQKTKSIDKIEFPFWISKIGTLHAPKDRST